jgi:hypothetical protein
MFSLGVNDADDDQGARAKFTTQRVAAWQGREYISRWCWWRRQQPLPLGAVAPEAKDAFQNVTQLSDGNGIEYLWEQFGQPAVTGGAQRSHRVTPELRL